MPDITVDKEYIKTQRGLLQMVAAVLSLIGFICACIWGEPIAGLHGAGFVQFATIMGFLVALGFFIVNLFMQSITNYRPMGLLVETICYAVMVVLLVIAGIVAAAYAGRYRYYVNRNITNGAAAAAAFSFFAAIPFGILAFFVFRDWQASRTGTGTTSTSTTTTTTTTKVEATY